MSDNEKPKPGTFVPVDRSVPFKKGELLAIWTAGIEADMAKARAAVDEWFAVNVWGKKP